MYPWMQDEETGGNPKFNAARKLRNPESRLRAFLELCSGKKHDDSTGGPQPAYRTEAGMKITAEFPKNKDADDDMQDQAERKQVSLSTMTASLISNTRTAAAWSLMSYHA